MSRGSGRKHALCDVHGDKAGKKFDFERCHRAQRLIALDLSIGRYQAGPDTDTWEASPLARSTARHFRTPSPQSRNIYYHVSLTPKQSFASA